MAEQEIKTFEVPFIKSDEDRRYTLGVVYAPGVVDAQGDFATAAEIEKACWDFNQRLQGIASLEKGMLGLQHKDWADSNGSIVESYVAPADMVISGKAITKGTWLMGTIWSHNIWKKIKDGDVTGLSMGGSGVRTKVETVNA